jgi:hypothetical protein
VAVKVDRGNCSAFSQKTGGSLLVAHCRCVQSLSMHNSDATCGSSLSSSSQYTQRTQRRQSPSQSAYWICYRNGIDTSQGAGLDLRRESTVCQRLIDTRSEDSNGSSRGMLVNLRRQATQYWRCCTNLQKTEPAHASELERGESLYVDTRMGYRNELLLLETSLSFGKL